MPRQPEGRLVKKIRDRLHDRGAWTCKIQGDGDTFQEVGLPDIFCCYRGFFIGLEVKTDAGDPSARQLAVLKRIQAAGGVGRVVRSWDEVERILAKLDRKR